MNRFTSLLATAAILATIAGCAPRMTVAEFVNARLLRDAKISAVLEAADSADKAFNLVADTPIQEIDANPQKIQEAVNKAHDSWRRAQSFRSNMSSSLIAEGVKLVDLGTPEAERVPVAQRGGIVFRVQATRYRVVVLGVETSRGVSMLRFDTAMNPSAETEFQDYLRGDRVDVGGAFVGHLKRGGTFVKREDVAQAVKEKAPDTERKAEDPKAPAPTLTPTLGCSKDTDCKGDRICVNAACVDPAK